MLMSVDPLDGLEMTESLGGYYWFGGDEENLSTPSTPYEEIIMEGTLTDYMRIDGETFYSTPHYEHNSHLFLSENPYMPGTSLEIHYRDRSVQITDNDEMIELGDLDIFYPIDMLSVYVSNPLMGGVVAFFNIVFIDYYADDSEFVESIDVSVYDYDDDTSLTDNLDVEYDIVDGCFARFELQFDEAELEMIQKPGYVLKGVTLDALNEGQLYEIGDEITVPMGWIYLYAVYEEAPETPLLFESNPITDGLIEYVA